MATVNICAVITSDVSHLTCWCWAVPDSVTGQWVPALQGLLGFHGWRSSGQTVQRRWSPHRSPPHPSSLTHLTIAGPGIHSTHLPHKHRQAHKWTCTKFQANNWNAEHLCSLSEAASHNGCICSLCWHKESDTVTPTHSFNTSPPPPPLFYDLIPD